MSPSAPIISVTEDRVTITANDTEESIRASAGFPETEPTKVDPTDEVEPAATTGARNADGTFKAKAEAEAKEPEKTDAAKPAAENGAGDPRKSHQAKINQAIAKQREAERRAEAAEAELQALRTPKPTQTPQPAASEPAKAPASTYLQDVQRYQSHADAPKLDDFVTAGVDDPYSAYHAALAVFIADQRASERETRTTHERALRERADKANEAFAIAEQNHPGIRAQINADTRIYPPAVLNLLADEAVQNPHLSAEILAHLVTHPEDADALARLDAPIAAAREIGRLIARLSSASSGPETVSPAHTNAKPLIKPVRPSMMAAESSSPDDLPFGPKYIAAMNERERKAKEARHA